MTQKTRFKPPKTAVQYDLEEICTGCSQINGISFWQYKLHLNCTKLVTLPNTSKKCKMAFLLRLPEIRRTKLLQWICSAFTEKFRTKKPTKNSDQTFYFCSFPNPRQSLLFWSRYQYIHSNSTLGRPVR